MRKFKFKYEALERVRINRETAARLAFSAAQRSLQEEIRRKEDLIRSLSSALSRRESLADVPVSVEEFHLEEHFIVGTKQRIIQADQAILRAQRAIDRALKIFLKARQQRMVIQKLKDRSFEAYKKERRRMIQRRSDETITMRAQYLGGQDGVA